MLGGFLVTVFLRQCLEFYISVAPTGVWWVDVTTFLHAGIFYGAFFTLLSFCLSHFAQWKFQVALKRVFSLTPLLLLAPVIDWVFFGRYGVAMAYHFVSFADFIEHFFSFFGPMTAGGVTFGMRVQVLGLLGIFGYWIYKERQSIGEVILATLASYALIYLIASTPSYIAWLEMIRTFHGGDVSSLVFDSVNANLFRLGDWGEGPVFTVLRFNTVMSQLWFSVLALFFAWKCKKALLDLYSWGRVWRGGIYISLFLLGVLISPHMLSHADVQFTVSSLVSLSAAIVVIISVWTYAFSLNDAYDVKTDHVVHSDRAIPRGLLSRAHVLTISFYALLLGFLGAATLGPLVLVSIVVFLVIATCYSAPPVQLRRYIAIPQLCMSLASLAIMHAGFSVAAKSGFETRFFSLFAGVGFMLFGLWFLKDIKDFEGDKSAGYDTLVTRFGVQKGARFTYILTVICLLVGLVLLVL